MGIIVDESDEPAELNRWHSESNDLRSDASIGAEIEKFMECGASYPMGSSESHEEGMDYALNETCPRCPYWENRDRFSGERID